MKKFLEKIVSSINHAGNAIFGRSTTKRVASAVLALTVSLSPLSPALVIAADEIHQDDVIEETTVAPTEEEITEVIIPSETTLPDFTEATTEETVIVEDDDIVVADPTETIDTTAPPMETEETTEETSEETTATETSVSETTVEETVSTETEVAAVETEAPVEEKTCNIVIAGSADEYFKLISSLPDGYQRVIVDTRDDLTSLEVASGVYYDGTYILVFDDGNTYAKGIKSISDAGYEYAIDGTLSVCGNFGSVISYGSINPNAKVKVAVIDTGSELANEKYSVIGDDTSDHDGHGTAMCNYILNETDNAYIISIKAIGDNGKGNMSDVYAAVQLAEDLGVDYILMAISIRNSGKYDAFESLIKSTKAIVVAAAGNNGTDAAKYFPAGIDGVITVGAIGEHNFITSFSNYGTCVEYYVKDAESTSEASAVALGKIIAGRADELSTSGYRSDANIYYSEGSEYYFVTDETFPNSNEAVRIGGSRMTYIYNLNSPVNSSGEHNTLSDYDDVAYCAWSKRDNPWATYEYGLYWDFPASDSDSGSDRAWARNLEAALALGPGGELYELGLKWWKDYAEAHPGWNSGDYWMDQNWYYSCDDWHWSNGNKVTDWSQYTPKTSEFTLGTATWRTHYTMYLITHFMVDYIYSDDPYGWDGMGNFGTAMDAYYSYIKSLRSGNEPESKYCSGWWAQVYIYGNAGSSTDNKYQRMAIGGAKLTKTTTLTLSKSSSNPSVTNGNSAYDLNGTTYKLYANSNQTDELATFVINSNGTTTTTFEATLGKTYYLKETVAGKGYKLDSTLYTVTVSSNGTVSVNNGVSVSKSNNINVLNVTDPGETTDISLTKAVSNTTFVNGNSCYSIAGTTYGLYSDSACTNSLTTFTVDASGNTTTKYNTPYGKTYYLKETKAGKGFELDDTVYTVTVNNSGVVSVNYGVSVSLSNNTYYLKLSDKPLRDDFTIQINKTVNGSVISNGAGAYNGAKFRLEYYQREVTDFSTLTYANADIVFEFTVNSQKTLINRQFLAGLTPVKGTNTFASLSGRTMPLGTYRLQEIDAPDGFACAPDVWIMTIYDDPNTDNQVIRTSYKITASGKTTVSDIIVDNTASTAYININEPVVMGRYHLTKSMSDNNIIPNAEIKRYTFGLYANSGANGAEELIATGTVDADGSVLWTYAGTRGLALKGNDNNTPLSQRVLESGLAAGKTHNIILPVWKTNTEKFTYTVHEYRPETNYGKTDIEYSASVPNGWTKVSDHEFKTTFTLDGNAAATSMQYPVADNSTPVTSMTVTNHEEFTGLNVKKVVPTNNPFDVTKVTFKVYNTDNGKDTLIANGNVDSKGNVTWYRVDDAGFGTAPKSSVNVLNYLPLGHYRIEESWNKEYLNLNSQISILVEEKNNNGWVKTETKTTYTYSYAIDLSAKSNDGKVTSLSVENESLVQEFNLTKTVKVAGDASTIKAELYLISDNKYTLISTGSCKTNGIGTYGFTWDYKGTHVTKAGLDTLVLPVGKYRVIEYCPETYYKNTQVPFTYKTPEGFTAKTVNGKLQFYKDFELAKGDYKTISVNVTNVRIEGSFDIVKVERSDDSTSKTFNFEVYYRGNGASASDTATLIDKVTITTTNGKGSATLKGLPEGWYEIREVGADSKWTTHWLGGSANKSFRLVGSTNAGKMVVYNDVAPEIKTTLVDRSTQDHIAERSTTATLEDTVSYKHLLPGHYVMSGVLMDKNTGKELLDAKGNKIIGSTEFDVKTVLDEYGEPVPQSGTVKVTFTLDTTILENVTIVAFEELHASMITGKLVAKHADINDVDQTIVVPKVRTTLKDSVTDDHVAALESVTLIDTVAYDNLIIGKEYSVTGILVNADTGKEIKDKDGKVITSTTVFTAKTKAGTIEVKFTVSPELLKGTKVVAFEDLKYKNIKIATHADITDEEQTVFFPEIHTTLIDRETKEHIAGQNTVIRLVDTVTYNKLKPGLTYTMRGTLMDKTTGKALLDKDGKPITAEKSFTPTAESGTVEIEFEFDGSLLKGDTLVAFEECRLKDKKVAVHNDINDVDQTVDIPDIHTTFFDLEIGETEDFVRAGQDVTLVDRVYFTNLKPGLEYTLTGTIKVKETGEDFKDAKGNAYITTVIFKPETAAGYVDVEFVVNTDTVAGQTLVAFETLDYKGFTLVVHADIEDVDQTVSVPLIWTKASDADNGTQTLTYKERVTIIDTVAYENLIPGKTYVVTGTLYNVSTGKVYTDIDGKTYTAAAEFTPVKANGTVNVVFKEVLVPYTKTEIVVFENLSYKDKNIKIATHSDITDKDQTVERPTAGTTATINGNKEVWLASTEVRNLTITDTIAYTGLQVGTLYRAEATLYKADGTQILVSGQPLKSIVEFTPTTKDGTVEVSITFSTEGLSEGDRLVVFEKVFDVATEAETLNGTQTNDLLIARHEDLSDDDQTITIHFRPTTGEITPSYIYLGAGLVALSALMTVFLVRRKRRLISPN